MSIYKAIKDSNHNVKNVAVTVLSGEFAGEKALLAGGEIVWTEREDGFLAPRAATLAGTEGTAEIDGTKVFAEVLGNEKKLVICGGGHVSIPVIRIARMLGFHVTVLEDRADFAENAKAAGAQEVILASYTDGLAQVKGNGDTFFAVITRGHRYDTECLENIFKKERAYVGMIGSRRHVALAKEHLEAAGFSKEEIDGLHAPIGLAIGSETPAEIAVSIIAEIIEVKNRAGRNFVYSKELLRAIDAQESGTAVLATIIGRTGSAPRSVGAKMLVCADGTIEETIGGGSGEADVIARALRMIETGEPGPVIHHTEMTSLGTAEDEGMVCGGTLDVLLEMI